MAKAPKGPQVMTANALSEGDVLFLSKDNKWVLDLQQAQIGEGEAELAAMEATGAQGVANNLLIEPYFIEIEQTEGRISPVTTREKMRSLGPSVRKDLGKQAVA